MAKKFRYIATLSCVTAMAASLLSSCSELLPFINNSTPSVEEGLPGIWATSSLFLSEGNFEIYSNSVPRDTISLSTLPSETEISHGDPLFTIIKFFDNNISLIEGTTLFDSDLLIKYPYSLSENDLISSDLFKKHFRDTEYFISDMTRNSFSLVKKERGFISDPPEDAPTDTFCISRTSTINFKRLR